MLRIYLVAGQLLLTLLMSGCGFEAARQQRMAQVAAQEALDQKQAAASKSRVELALEDRERLAQRQAWARPFPMIGYRKDQADQIKAGAEMIAKEFKAPTLSVGDRNPRCCIWIEIIGKANPGEPGWVFLHEAGGSFLWATDSDQLILAIAKLTELSKASPVEFGLPLGVTTSYRTNGN